MINGKFLCLVVALSSMSFAFGWSRYGRQHVVSRNVSAATLDSAPQKRVAAPLHAWLDTSDLVVGQRVDILVSTDDLPVPLIFDALVSHKDVRNCWCVMPLADGRLLGQAAANGTKITCRASVVPGEWGAAQRN